MITGTITVTPGQASQLQITTPPYPIAAGSSFDLIVTALDADGNVDTNYTGGVSLSLPISIQDTPQGTMSVTAIAGVATFGDLKLDKAEAVTINAISGALASAATNSFTVTASPATQIVVTPPQGPVTEDEPFTVVVSAEDQFGNVDPTFSGTVTLDSTDGLGGTTTLQARYGVATFSGLTVGTTGSVSFSATANGLRSGPATPPVPVNPPPAVPLVTISSLQIATNKKHLATKITISFDGDVNVSNVVYRLATPGKKGSYTAKNAKSIEIRSESYDPINHILTIIPQKAFALTKQVQLQIAGLHDSLGRYISGHSAGTVTAIIGKRGVVVSVVTQKPDQIRMLAAAVDSVLSRITEY